jgi:hypothetical protein
MKHALSHKIGLMRLFWGVVVAYASRLAIYRNAGSPAALIRNDTNKTRLVSFVWAPNILRISIRKHYPKVDKTIVVFNPIQMVYHSGGPFASHVQPDQTMRFVNAAAQAYKNVAFIIRRACHIAYMYGFSHAFCPSKQPGNGIVVQYAANVICGKIGNVHAVAPVKQWFEKWTQGAATPYACAYVTLKITGLQP